MQLGDVVYFCLLYILDGIVDVPVERLESCDSFHRGLVTSLVDLR